MTSTPAQTSQVDPRELRPRRFWYLVALGIALLGVVAGVGIFAAGMFSIVRGLPDLHQRFGPGERVTVKLSAGEHRTIYAATAGSSARCRAVNAAPGVDVTRSPYSFEFTSNGSTWYALYEVRATRAGRYTLECRNAGRAYALGEPPELGRFFVSLFGGIVAFIVLPMLGVIVGGVIALVVYLRRNSDRKRIQAQYSAPYLPPPA